MRRGTQDRSTSSSSTSRDMISRVQELMRSRGTPIGLMSSSSSSSSVTPVGTLPGPRVPGSVPSPSSSGSSGWNPSSSAPPSSDSSRLLPSPQAVSAARSQSPVPRSASPSSVPGGESGPRFVPNVQVQRKSAAQLGQAMRTGERYREEEQRRLELQRKREQLRQERMAQKARLRVHFAPSVDSTRVKKEASSSSSSLSESAFAASRDSSESTSSSLHGAMKGLIGKYEEMQQQGIELHDDGEDLGMIFEPYGVVRYPTALPFHESSESLGIAEDFAAAMKAEPNALPLFYDFDRNDILQDQLFFIQMPSALPSSRTIDPTSDDTRHLAPSVSDSASVVSASTSHMSVLDDQHMMNLMSDPGTSHARSESSSRYRELKEDPLITSRDVPNSLRCVPPGPIGELVFYKNGKVKLKIGDVEYNVSPGADCQFHQEFMALDPDRKTAVSLGDVKRRIVVTPNVESFSLCPSSTESS